MAAYGPPRGFWPILMGFGPKVRLNPRARLAGGAIARPARSGEIENPLIWDEPSAQ